MTMTKKDYERIAAALQHDAAHLDRVERRDYSQMTDWEKGAYDQWSSTVLAVASMLAREPGTRFDRARFLAACGVAS